MMCALLTRFWRETLMTSLYEHLGENITESQKSNEARWRENCMLELKLSVLDDMTRLENILAKAESSQHSGDTNQSLKLIHQGMVHINTIIGRNCSLMLCGEGGFIENFVKDRLLCLIELLFSFPMEKKPKFDIPPSLKNVFREIAA